MNSVKGECSIATEVERLNCSGSLATDGLVSPRAENHDRRLRIWKVRCGMRLEAGGEHLLINFARGSEPCINA